jgi:GNAT superfamily N-acetyltransferase
MRVLKADRSHIPAILELWKELMDFHRPFDALFTRSEDGEASMATHLEQIIDAEDSLVLVAVEAAGVIGYTMAKVASYPPVFVKRRHGLISDMAVSRAHRRRGCGEMMLEVTLEWFRQKGLDRVELRVAAKNGVAYSFWRKQGFADYVHELYREI